MEPVPLPRQLLRQVRSGCVNTRPGRAPRSVTRTSTWTGRQRALRLTGAGACALDGRYRFDAVHRAALVTDLSTVTTMWPPGKTPTTAAAGPGQWIKNRLALGRVPDRPRRTPRRCRKGGEGTPLTRRNSVYRCFFLVFRHTPAEELRINYTRILYTIVMTNEHLY